MVAFVYPLSSGTILQMIQYFPFSSGILRTEMCCLTLSWIFPDILKLPNNLLLNEVAGLPSLTSLQLYISVISSYTW